MPEVKIGMPKTCSRTLSPSAVHMPFTQVTLLMLCGDEASVVDRFPGPCPALATQLPNINPKPVLETCTRFFDEYNISYCYY